MPETINDQASSIEPEFIQQIRRNKEEIAAQIGPMLDAGHQFEELAAWVTDGSDRLGAMFCARHPGCSDPMVAVMSLPDMARLADSIQTGGGASFREPAPRGCIRILSCAKGKAHAAILRCFPENMAAA